MTMSLLDDLFEPTRTEAPPPEARRWELLSQALYANKLGDTAKVNGLLKQIMESTMPGDDAREKAIKQLGAPKQ